MLLDSCENAMFIVWVSQLQVYFTVYLNLKALIDVILVPALLGLNSKLVKTILFPEIETSLEILTLLNILLEYHILSSNSKFLCQIANTIVIQILLVLFSKMLHHYWLKQYIQNHKSTPMPYLVTNLSSKFHQSNSQKFKQYK